MSRVLAQLRQDLNTARRAQDKPHVLLLGTIISDIGNREIEVKRALTDDDVIEVVRRGIKKRRESIDLFQRGGRTDLVEKERLEVERLATYVPADVNAEEIRTVVRAAIAAGALTLGAVMGKVVPQFKGRAEGGVINAIAREELGKAV